MAIKVQGQTVVSDDRKGSFQVSNPGSFTTAQRDALSAEAGDQVFNTDTDKLEIYDGSDWKGVGSSGNTISSTEPVDKEIGDLWTDTSSDPPVLKTWNGSSWITYAAGSGSGGYAGQINSLSLAEADETGDRFTGKTFNATFGVTEGSPATQKGVKGEVEASFQQYPLFDPVDSNSSTSFPSTVNTGKTTFYLSQALKGPIPVNQPNDGLYGYLWFTMNSGSSGSLRFNQNVSASVNSLEIMTVNGISQASLSPFYCEGPYVEIIQPTENDPITYYTVHGRQGEGTSAAWFTNNQWYFTTKNIKNVVWDQATKQYYFVDWDNQGKVHRSPICPYNPSYSYNNANTVAANNYYTSNRRLKYGGYVAIINGYVIANYQESSNDYNPYMQKMPVNFTENFYPELQYSPKQGNNQPGMMYSIDGYLYLTFLSTSDGNFWRCYGAPTTSGSWTDISYQFSYDASGNTYYNDAYPNWLTKDPATGTLICLFKQHSTNDDITIRYSNNFGSNWQPWYISGNLSLPSYYSAPNTYKTEITSMVFGNGYITFPNDKAYQSDACSVWSKYITQTVTLEGTGEDYALFSPGDTIRKAGTTDVNSTGLITGISGLDVSIDSNYLFKDGDIIEGINPTGSGLSTRYLIIATNGQVQSTSSVEQDYVNLGPLTDQSITFPAMFPTGNTPDEEFPEGTGIKIFGKLSNDAGTDTYGPSNTVTPA